MIEDPQLNWFDIAFMAIVAVSTAVAFIKGFNKTIGSIFLWIAACIATIFLFDFVTSALLKHTNNIKIASAFAGVGLFIGILSLMYYVKAKTTKKRRKQSVDVMDKSLGAVFGFIRGVAMVVVVAVLIDIVRDSHHLGNDNNPSWYQEYTSAAGHQVLDGSARYVVQFIPVSSENKPIKQGVAKEDVVVEKKAVIAPPKGYEQGQLDDLDQLIQSVD